MLLLLLIAQAAPALPDVPVPHDLLPPGSLERFGPWGLTIVLAARLFGPALIAFFQGRQKAEQDREAKHDDVITGLVQAAQKNQEAALAAAREDAKERDRQFVAALAEQRRDFAAALERLAVAFERGAARAA